MNRRAFLSLLGLGATGFVIDPERLLWVPGQKTIFLPPQVRLLSMSEIVDMELRRMLPKLECLFESDNLLWQKLSDGTVKRVSQFR